MSAVAEWRNRLALGALKRRVDVRAELYRVMADTAQRGIAQTDVVSRMLTALPRNHPAVPIFSQVQYVLRGHAGVRGAPISGQRTVAGAMAPYLPDTEAAMILAGEQSGAVADGWRQAADYAHSQKALKDAIIENLSKPIFYFVAFIGMLLFMSYYLLPKFETPEMPRSKWPPLAQNLSWVADNVLVIVAVLVVLVLCTVVAVAVSQSRWTGDLRRIADARLPVFRLFSAVQGAAFMKALASFMASGISFGDAIDRMKRLSNPYMAWQLQQIQQHVRSGARPERAIVSASMIPVEYHWAVLIYGMSAAVDAARAYDSIAQEILNGVQKRLRHLFGSILSNLMLFLLGGGILVVYFSMYEISMSVAKNIG